MASLFSEAKWFKTSGTKPCNFSVNEESEWGWSKKRPLWQVVSLGGLFVNRWGKKISQTITLPGKRAVILQHKISPAESKISGLTPELKRPKFFSGFPLKLRENSSDERSFKHELWNKKSGSRPIWSWLKAEFPPSEEFFQWFWLHLRREDARPPPLCLRSQFFCLWQSLKGVFQFQSLSSQGNFPQWLSQKSERGIFLGKKINPSLPG